MTVRELNREQLTELKEHYFTELVNEGTFAEVIGRDYDAPSYGDLADIDEIVSDEFIFEHYEGIDFVNDDFFCSAGTDEQVMNVFVITVDWKDRQFEPELVGVYANEDKAREAQGNKILELEEQGYVEGDDFYVWFEDTFVIE